MDSSVVRERVRGGEGAGSGRLLRGRLLGIAVVVGLALMLTLAFWPAGGGRQQVQLTFANLAPLANGYHYEGWAVIDGQPWSTGRFNVGQSGDLVGLDAKTVSEGLYDAGRDLSETVMVAITIQPPVGSPGSPVPNDDGSGGDAAPHLLAGPIADFGAVLTAGARAALGSSFADASGSFVLEHGHVHLSSLVLPSLPAGWAYEAWADYGERTESLGRFGEAAIDHGGHAHDHGGGQPEGSVAVLEHFVPAEDVRGATVFISIEPSPDDSPAPFGLRTLTGRVPTDAREGVAYPMENRSAQFPTGTATIR